MCQDRYYSLKYELLTILLKISKISSNNVVLIGQVSNFSSFDPISKLSTEFPKSENAEISNDFNQGIFTL